MAENSETAEGTPIIISRRLNTSQSVSVRDTMVLKEGPQSRKIAKHLVITNARTGKLHHHAVQLETQRLRKFVWERDDKNSLEIESPDAEERIGLGDESGGEIEKLRMFLDAVLDEHIPVLNGEFLVLPLHAQDNPEGFAQTIALLMEADHRSHLVSALVELGGNTEKLLELARNVREQHPLHAEGLAAALTLAEYREQLNDLRTLVDRNARESDLQSILWGNSWMFGSEYSEIVPSRELIARQQNDFVMRRTLDGFLEIVEIKTTLGGEALFRFDRDHQCFYPRSELARVIGQVMNYLEELDVSQDTIYRRWNERVSKTRAKIILGRDGDDVQLSELRKLNSHLNRIEVLTFDQLIRMAERVVGFLRADVESAVKKDHASLGDVPF